MLRVADGLDQSAVLDFLSCSNTQLARRAMMHDPCLKSACCGRKRVCLRIAGSAGSLPLSDAGAGAGTNAGVCMYVACVTRRLDDRGLLRITTTTADVLGGGGREGTNTNGINQYRGGGGRGGGDGGGAKG